MVRVIVQRFSMDNVSNKDPEDLLREIAEKGISQSICVNDLGTSFLTWLCNQAL